MLTNKPLFAGLARLDLLASGTVALLAAVFFTSARAAGTLDGDRISHIAGTVNEYVCLHDFNQTSIDNRNQYRNKDGMPCEVNRTGLIFKSAHRHTKGVAADHLLFSYFAALGSER